MLQMFDLTYGLPEPWDLDDHWLDRLPVSEELRRRYGHLSPTERMMVEVERRLYEEYRSKGLLRESAPGPKGITRRNAQDRDEVFLKAGKGRAVDCLATFEVLHWFDIYRDWMESLPRAGTRILDVIVPYCLNDFAVNLGFAVTKGWGIGAFRIMATGFNPKVGEIREFQWDRLTFEIREVKILREPTLEAFESNPYEFICPENRNIDQVNSGNVRKVGLLEWATRNEHVKIPFPDGQHHTLNQRYNSFTVNLPTVEGVQTFLDWLTATSWYYRVPRHSKMALQLDVSPGITSITSVWRPNLTEQGGIPFYQKPYRIIT